ncbi:MAG: DUF3788 domain-containing protein [Oscillospiraceae bacterium]|jgi:hypothetical protein|nr:DUF3788 domain-containing protein [Oscillospiraceae bacterium]MCX4256632.1 DUF3788 domain-containing protein [Oscillospiraceae bacterium]
MYERMLDKHIIPTASEMTEYCGKNAGLFNLLNEWLSETYGTVQKVVFPYGNNYGWGISHKKKEKLVCNIFAENNSFTVMMRLSDKQFDSIYDRVEKYTQEYINNKYPCGNGGWIHYRVTEKSHFDDIQKLLDIKCS